MAPPDESPEPPPAEKPKRTKRSAKPEPPTLRVGDRGESVHAAQLRLRAAGATLEVNGRFTPATRAAVRAFQDARELPVTGELDPATLAVLG